MKTYKVIKQEKLNLQKWEVQKEPFLLVIDNIHKLRYLVTTKWEAFDSNLIPVVTI